MKQEHTAKTGLRRADSRNRTHLTEKKKKKSISGVKISIHFILLPGAKQQSKTKRLTWSWVLGRLSFQENQDSNYTTTT